MTVNNKHREKQHSSNTKKRKKNYIYTQSTVYDVDKIIEK